MYDICCVGHITLDKIITPGNKIEMAGGTSFYFSNAVQHLDLHYLLVTAIATPERRFVDALQTSGIEVKAFPSNCTVCFENVYAQNMDERVQKVWQKSNAFTVDQLQTINAGIFHLGPLLADDIPPELIRHLAARATVSLDVQGYLREVKDHNVHAIDWQLKRQLLPYISILKANEEEMYVLTGEKNVEAGAAILADWGVKEVIITCGSKGSVIYIDGSYVEVPAYINGPAKDATGCGDTYMAGYLYQRVKGASPLEAGQFASAMAGLKAECSGPFSGNAQQVLDLLAAAR